MPFENTFKSIMKKLFSIGLVFFLLLSCETEVEKVLSQEGLVKTEYADLVRLFKAWRTFETPPLYQGAPDYTAATFAKRWPEFKQIQSNLMAIDTTGWVIENKVDWLIVWAEMNGYDFNHRILKPWARDPAFYTSIYMYPTIYLFS